MSRRNVVLVGAAVVVVAGVATGAWLITRSSSTTATGTLTKTTTTAEVQQKDLTLYDETTATLGFTTSVTVSSPVAGTVTTVVAPGAHVDPGTVVATVDGAPVVALLGDVPSYRNLSTSSANGIDVRQLEQNLVMLGFDPAGAITVDQKFDSATAASVTLWEDSLGLSGDGKVPKGEVVYVPGHLLVDTASTTVGAAVSSGGSLFVARQTEGSYLVSASGANGVAVSRITAAGTAVTTGTVLFWHGDLPVVAIEGDAATLPALTRDLSTASKSGVDIRMLEVMLVAGGFDPDKAITVNDTFDAATAAAVQRWWASLGVTVDAANVVVPAGSFVVVPGGLFTGTPLVTEGTTPAGDAVVLGLTTAAREVTTSAPIGSASFALGATIDVEFPDGTISKGTVVDVGTVATTSSNAPGATPSVTITLHVADIPASVNDFVQIPVTLRVVSQSEPNAFVVPVSALVALAEGGYAIEVVDATSASGANTTHLLAVTTGLFADGFVSVTGDGLAKGLQVVVPS